jgi:hypothetical protein
MSFEQTLIELRAKREQIDAAISSIEVVAGMEGVVGITAGTTAIKRRGRPPGSGVAGKSAAGGGGVTGRKRTPAQKAAQAASMRKIWAKKKRAKAKAEAEKAAQKEARKAAKKMAKKAVKRATTLKKEQPVENAA